MDMKFSLPPFKEYKLRGFENRVLRRVRYDMIYLFTAIGFPSGGSGGKLVRVQKEERDS